MSILKCHSLTRLDNGFHFTNRIQKTGDHTFFWEIEQSDVGYVRIYFQAQPPSHFSNKAYEVFVKRFRGNCINNYSPDLSSVRITGAKIKRRLLDKGGYQHNSHFEPVGLQVDLLQPAPLDLNKLTLIHFNHIEDGEEGFSIDYDSKVVETVIEHDDEWREYLIKRQTEGA